MNRVPTAQRKVSEVTDLLRTILLPFLEHHRQITVIVDGLDRLIEPVRFREFAEQDLRAVRGLKVTVIVAVRCYCGTTDPIPARLLRPRQTHSCRAADPKESGFLKDVLNRRGASQLMSAASMNEICSSLEGCCAICWLSRNRLHSMLIGTPRTVSLANMCRQPPVNSATAILLASGLCNGG